MTEAGRRCVVAGVDGSPRSVPVLQWADQQAQLTGAQLVALTATGADPGAPGWPDDTSARAAQQLLTQAVAAALPPERAAVAELRIEPQAPHEALIAESEWAEAVVLGVHHARAMHPLRSVTARVVAAARSPIVVVRRHQPTASRLVVVGVNGAASARPALAWAIRQARLLDGVVDALLAWEWQPEYPVYPYGEDLEKLRVEQEAVLAGELARLPFEARDIVRSRVVQGHPVHVLLEAARDADLLVVGIDGHHSIADHVLGVVSRRIVRHAPVPTVVVPSTLGVPT